MAATDECENSDWMVVITMNFVFLSVLCVINLNKLKAHSTVLYVRNRSHVFHIYNDYGI